MTERELQIAILLAEDKSSKEIAHLLRISVKTADFHRMNLKKKLGGTAAIVRWLIRNGYVKP